LTGVVVDASVALSWCFPDEKSDYADSVLIALKGDSLIVPAIWPVEIANAVWVGERRKRIKPIDVRNFEDLLWDLTIVEISHSVAESMANLLPVARKHNLSAYDATYLDIALRRNAPLATLDLMLEKAGRDAGIKLFKP
jgi:predicted nucleic acid-binding protein